MDNYIKEIMPQYEDNLWKVTIGVWSQQQWYEYCAEILEKIMIENKNVLERLKNR
jgi:hypothetical protein